MRDYIARSRKVVKRSNARNTGKYPSWKMKRMMQWESVYKGNAMRILDATPMLLLSVSYRVKSFTYLMKSSIGITQI